MISLRNLIDVTGGSLLSGKEDANINEIRIDSRKVNAGDAFIAVKGNDLDGHDFISHALENGASVIFLQQVVEINNEQVSVVQLSDSRKAMAEMAAFVNNYPSEKLLLVGVTGTNGKTTVVSLLFRLFTELGHKCGLLSTVENLITDEKVEATHTTPNPFEINELLSRMVDAGCTYAFMEVSSHAIDQDRIYRLNYDGRLFTNITHEHLDYHGDFKAYIKAKKKFFDSSEKDSFALVNADDKNGRIMVQNAKASVKTYALKSMADYRAKIIENDFSGLHLLIDGHEVHFRLIGRFNAYNLLTVYGTAVELGMDRQEVLKVLSHLSGAPGRFDVVTGDSKITAIVDYAHTPDALENVLSTIKSMTSGGSRRIYSLVGCGGDRDKMKRPEMAKIACQYSDVAILTSDNPRTEVPSEIIDDMMKGVPEQTQCDVMRIESREDAIKIAVRLAKEHDIVLVTGKGHETYQEIKGVKHPFDDKKVLKEALFHL